MQFLYDLCGLGGVWRQSDFQGFLFPFSYKKEL